MFDERGYLRERVEQLCARELDYYLAELHNNQKPEGETAYTSVPWWRTGAWAYLKADIPRLEWELKAAFDAKVDFSSYAPFWAQPLLLCPEDCRQGDQDGKKFVRIGFACSLWCRFYDYKSHPSFEDYGRGMVHALPWLRRDPEIRALLPPRELPGLDAQMCWLPLR